MMRAYGALAAVAALLVCCSADPHQEQEGSVSGNSLADHFESELQKDDYEDFLRFLVQYDNRLGNPAAGYGRNVNGIGGNTLLGRNLGGGGLGGNSLLGRNVGGGGLGGNSLLGRNLGGTTLLPGRNLDGIGGSGLLGRNLNEAGSPLFGRYTRFLDSLGGANLVKKNLDQIGGPNLLKRTLDTLGGAYIVRRQDPYTVNNFARHLDTIGGANII